MNKKELLDLMRCAIFNPKDNTYRFFRKDFKDLWDAIEQLSEGEKQ